MRTAGFAPETGLLILRGVLGITFITHGWPKLMDGASGTAEFFGMLGIPVPGVSAWLITLLEVFGGFALVLGLLVPVFSALLIIHMLVGILLVHLPEGWFVVGPGTGGAEFSVLLIAGLLTLILTGPGRPALDFKLAGRAGETEAPAAGGPAVPPEGTGPAQGA